MVKQQSAYRLNTKAGNGTEMIPSLVDECVCPHCGTHRTHRRKPARGWFCKQCDRKKHKEWYKNGGALFVMILSAKKRALQKGIPFHLDAQDISIPEKCPVLGIPLRVGTRRSHWNAPTLDRIDPEKGYVRGNVIVVSWRANFLRSNGTLDELQKVLSFYQAVTNKASLL